jgi:hypothetical protein
MSNDLPRLEQDKLPLWCQGVRPRTFNPSPIGIEVEWFGGDGMTLSHKAVIPLEQEAEFKALPKKKPSK